MKPICGFKNLSLHVEVQTLQEAEAQLFGCNCGILGDEVNSDIDLTGISLDYRRRNVKATSLSIKSDPYSRLYITDETFCEFRDRNLFSSHWIYSTERLK